MDQKRSVPSLGPLLFALVLAGPSSAFAPVTRQCRLPSSIQVVHAVNDGQDGGPRRDLNVGSAVAPIDRRALLAFGAGLAGVGLAPSTAHADNILDRGLLGSALEQVRIASQSERDDLPAGDVRPLVGSPNSGTSSKLTTTLDGSLPPTEASGPVRLLLPIVQIEAQLLQAQRDVQSAGSWKAVLDTLSKEPYAPKQAFKSVFNRYADNIYLAKGDDRANAYLGGGATPSSLQTVQYMLRNDLLTNLDNITQELQYLLRCIKEGQSAADLEASELGDLRQYFKDLTAGLKQYLDIPPKEDVAEARRIAVAGR